VSGPSPAPSWSLPALPFLHRLVSFGDFIDSMERSDSHPRCGELWLSLVRRPHRRPLVDADGSHRFRSGPFGRDVVQAPGGASGLSHDETRCAAFAGAGASSASATCRFRESMPHPVQPLSTLRTPRRRDARKTRSRPACSALNGPDFHWQAHSSFPLARRVAQPLLAFAPTDPTVRRYRSGLFRKDLRRVDHCCHAWWIAGSGRGKAVRSWR